MVRAANLGGAEGCALDCAACVPDRSRSRMHHPARSNPPSNPGWRAARFSPPRWHRACTQGHAIAVVRPRPLGIRPSQRRARALLPGLRGHRRRLKAMACSARPSSISSNSSGAAPQATTNISSVALTTAVERWSACPCRSCRCLRSHRRVALAQCPRRGRELAPDAAPVEKNRSRMSLLRQRVQVTLSVNVWVSVVPMASMLLGPLASAMLGHVKMWSALVREP